MDAQASLGVESDFASIAIGEQRGPRLPAWLVWLAWLWPGEPKATRRRRPAKDGVGTAADLSGLQWSASTGARRSQPPEEVPNVFLSRSSSPSPAAAAATRAKPTASRWPLWAAPFATSLGATMVTAIGLAWWAQLSYTLVLSVLLLAGAAAAFPALHRSRTM